MTNRTAIIRSLSFAAIACMVLPVAAAAAGEKVKLKARFPKGRQRYVEVSRETDQAVRGPATGGREIKLNVVTLEGVIEKVLTASKKRVELELTVDRKAMHLRHPALGKHGYDSDVPTEGASAQFREILEPTVGMSLTLKMDRASRKSTITGMEAIAGKIEAGVSPGNKFYPSMKDELDDANAAADWGASRFWLLPDKKLEVGATWTPKRKEHVPSRGGATYEANCKLERLEQRDGRQVAIITYSGTVKPNPDEPALPGGTGLTVSLVEGTFEGTATFDVKRGEIIHRIETAKTKLNAAFKVGTKTMPGMDIDMTIKATTTIQSMQDRAAEKIANRQASKQEADEKKTDR